MIDCRLIINGVDVADTGAALTAGTPTALADLSITWGRETTVDQPDAATCTATITDAGAVDFPAAVWLGAPVQVHAAGDISTGQPVNTFTDPSFESLPVGPVTMPTRFYPPERVTIVTPGAVGTRAVAIHERLDNTTPSGNVIAPAVFSADPTAWDAIPRAEPGATWDVSITYRTRVKNFTVSLQTLSSPSYPPQYTGATAGNTLPPSPSWTTWTWRYPLPGTFADSWIALRIIATLLRWDEMAATWAATPGTWEEYGTVFLDDVKVAAPSTGTDRDVLMFAGRVTDLAATVDPAGTRRIEMIAVDQLGELGNRWIGVAPWPQETVPQRVARILSAAGVTAQTIIDPAFTTVVVAPQDVDNQSAANLLQELAAGVDAVMWTAAHVTLGAYLRFLDLAAVGGAGTVLDGCDIDRDGVAWRIDVGDVITRVDVTWQDVTTTPATERIETVDNAAGIAAYGVRRHGVNSPVTTVAAARVVANRILARSSVAAWRTDEAARDLGLVPDRDGTERAALLDLLDGTIRLDRPVQITDVADWLTPTIAGTLTGGTYRYTPDGWALAMNLAPVQTGAD